MDYNKATKDLLIIKIQAEERDEAVGHKAIVKPSAWVIVYIYSQKNIKKFSFQHLDYLKIISSEYTLGSTLNKSCQGSKEIVTV